MTERGHRRRHERLEDWVRDLIRGARDRLGVESAWSITPEICCPATLPSVEASIWWDAEVFYASMQIRCDVPDHLVSWLVYHELCELQMWRSTTFLQDMLANLLPVGSGRGMRLAYQRRQTYLRQWRHQRNQEIECRIVGLLGQHRPAHLKEEMEGHE